jgi:ATP-dependent Clp protease ATP-binding subunit ClpB
MRFDKFTLKAQENLQISQQLAEKFGHQQIESEHILRALLEQGEGVIPSILGKIGTDQQQLVEQLDVALEKIPKSISRLAQRRFLTTPLKRLSR